MKTLVVKLDDNDFEKFYNIEMKKEGVDVISPSKIRNCNPNMNVIFKAVDFLIKLLILPNEINIKQYDLIIVFEDIKLIPIITRHKRKKTKVILWNWNLKSAKQAKLENILKKWCEIWTFDRNDAKKFNWKLNKQFYFQPQVYNNRKFMNKNEEIRAFCACVDKGRYRLMKDIRKKLQSHNVICDFWMVKQQDKIYDKEDESWIVNSGLQYKEFLDYTEKDDLIIDIVQNEQEGLTVRALEALFYNKKLITNNNAIKDELFFDSNNILIWDESAGNEIDAFIKLPYHICPSKIKEEYSFVTWISKFNV